MVTLVVVLDEPLPVGIDVHVPLVIVVKLFSEVELVHSLTFIHTVELAIPCYTWLLPKTGGFQIDPYKSCLVDMNMNRQETMLAPVESFDRIEARSFGEISFQAIGPAVVFTAQNAGGTTFLLDDGVCTVPAGIMEAVDVAAAVTDEEKGVVGKGEQDKFPGIAKAK